MMNIVTFTTDFGIRDYYAATLKGRILCYGLPMTFVDITHQIDAYNIVQAAFTLRNAYTAFPKGTVHVVSINNFYEPDPRFLLVLHDGHYFISADNGLFSLLFEEVPEYMYELPRPESTKNQMSIEAVQEIFAKATTHVLKGKPLHEIGVPTAKRVQRLSLQPITGKDYIRGAVIHVDNYENLILNIDRPIFDRIAQGRPFELYFKRFYPISELSQNYADVPVGELLCLFNSAGLLEISVNMGKAATLFGLTVDDTVQVDFLPIE